MMCSRTVGAANGTSDAVVTEAVPGMGREGKERRRGVIGRRRGRNRTKQDDEDE